MSDKIVVLAGGYSPEREVSLTSGALIANALIRKDHAVFLLDAYVGLKDMPADDCGWNALFRTIPDYAHKVQEAVPDLDRLKASCGNGNALIGPNVIEICRRADKVFLAMHGGMGENGQLQATLDTFGILYTGSGYVASTLAMDKDLSKRVFRFSDIPTADWIAGGRDEVTPEAVLAGIGLPCVVKPCGCGSSVGVTLVHTKDELNLALETAFAWEKKILAEKLIRGRELTVSVVDGKALPVIEIKPRSGFYDYKNKYQAGMTEEICPAPLTAEETGRVSAIAERAFAALGMHAYARFDFMMDEAGNFFCLEANSLPGMTPTSLLPQAAAAAGISYEALCEKIIGLI